LKLVSSLFILKKVLTLSNHFYVLTQMVAYMKACS